MTTCECGAIWSGLSICHCGACHLTFTGLDGFDLHRTGENPETRRCLTVTELERPRAWRSGAKRPTLMVGPGGRWQRWRSEDHQHPRAIGREGLEE